MSTCVRTLQIYFSMYFLSTVTQTAGNQNIFFKRQKSATKNMKNIQEIINCVQMAPSMVSQPFASHTRTVSLLSLYRLLSYLVIMVSNGKYSTNRSYYIAAQERKRAEVFLAKDLNVCLLYFVPVYQTQP